MPKSSVVQRISYNKMSCRHTKIKSQITSFFLILFSTLSAFIQNHCFAYISGIRNHAYILNLCLNDNLFVFGCCRQFMYVFTLPLYHNQWFELGVFLLLDWLLCHVWSTILPIAGVWKIDSYLLQGLCELQVAS